ncbi:tyrosine-type recombinase/integrase [Elizabethkingia anophelis]|uniref:site-specific integrase n=1 Tax=Elizabethkingia anophelis TaxID=1117645 RepID=UPI0021A90371|nr:tyrosine-type recombinase/integrase [Elizabethkingia anophelis]MCT3824075.1 tyrosine-type recombinase/integrase [Elizabethkingia anophelis]MCT3931392.1 tyrosine-type recombinase/integrase [Elizabethkingia anophelis]MCT4003711.1 tyrosine-type recombinase/integrase [Elizabethkingia anophelis]MCT4017803.1 tyrosine-type recombinase/integrase [Elizabethkingia anophelis]
MATIQLMLRNKSKTDGSLPIIFKIYHGTKSKVLTTPFSVLENQWDSKNKKVKPSHSKAREINESLKKIDTRLHEVIVELEAEEVDYNLNDIDTRFRNYTEENRVKSISVKDFFQQRIDTLNDAGKFNYAKIIKDSMTSLFKFEKNKNLRFKDIDFEYLIKYETFLSKTCENSSIKIKMIDLRTLYNLAINMGYAKKEHYPFKSYSIQKRLKQKSRKIALSEEQFVKFKNFDCRKFPKYTDTYKMFLFSYYVGGMNFKDMAFLEWGDIKDNRLYYTRSKTGRDFNVPLRAEALEILKYFQNYVKPEQIKYIFPIILRNDLTDKQLHGRYRRCLKIYNINLKFIAEQTGIEESITSYVSRHSFATHLKFNNVSADVISQIMGHSSVAVTNSYLKDFENDIIDDAFNKLS